MVRPELITGANDHQIAEWVAARLDTAFAAGTDIAINKPVTCFS